jgi:shikimate kinase
MIMPKLVDCPGHVAPHLVLPRTLVLVGLMGAGKTSVGRRLAARLGLPFRDADHEVEVAAGCSIQQIFDSRGEEEFRSGERKVIRRLLQQEPIHVLATGGGTYMVAETRRLIREKALTVWLRADLDVLVRRTSRRSHRPLLKQGNPREILGRLMELRYPVYADADLVVDTNGNSVDATVNRVLAALEAELAEC